MDYQKFQQDALVTANNMATQLYCQDRGIDYNLLLVQAQQAQYQNIMQMEQMRVMQQAMNRYYGNGNGLMGKIKDVFSGGNNAMMNPMMNPMMGAMPMMNPMMMMNPMQPAPIMPMGLPQPAPVSQPSPEMQRMEKELMDLRNSLNGLVTAISPQHP